MAHILGLRSRRGVLAVLGLALLAAFGTLLLLGYAPEQDEVNGQPVQAKWQNHSVTWSLNPVTGTNVDTTGGPDVATVLTNSFNSWQNAQVAGQTIVQLAITRGPDSNLTNLDPMNAADCVNLVSFEDSNTQDFPTGTIALTAITTEVGSPPFQYPCTAPPTQRTCNLPSCIVDADIVFNPKEKFSTATPPLSGDFDLQPTATHEIGHLLGLDHSGIAAAIMFPFGDTGEVSQRTLSTDDAAGIGFLYPAANFATVTGTIAGTITQHGSGIFAAHVVAIDANSGAAVLDGLTNRDGTYRLVGAPPGTYNVLALPLAGVYTLDDFGGWACGYDETQKAPPCCDPTMDPACTGTPVPNPTNYTGAFH